MEIEEPKIRNKKQVIDDSESDSDEDLFSDNNQFYNEANLNFLEIVEPLSYNFYSKKKNYFQQNNNRDNRLNNNKQQFQYQSNKIQQRPVQQKTSEHRVKDFKTDVFSKEYKQIMLKRFVSLLFDPKEMHLIPPQNKYFDMKKKNQILEFNELYQQVWSKAGDIIRVEKKKDYYDQIKYDDSNVFTSGKVLKIANYTGIIFHSYQLQCIERINFLSNKMHIFYDSTNIDYLQYIIYYVNFQFDPVIPQFYGFKHKKLMNQIQQDPKRFQGLCNNFLDTINIKSQQSIKDYIMQLNKRAKLTDPNFFGFDTFYGIKSISNNKQNNYYKENKEYDVIKQEEQHFAQLCFYTVVSLNTLAQGGSLVLKLYGCNLLKTNTLLYLINLCFNQMHFQKSYTSSQLSNEIYVICYGFNRAEEAQQKICEKLLENYEKLFTDYIPCPIQHVTSGNFEKVINSLYSIIRVSNLGFYTYLLEQISNFQSKNQDQWEEKFQEKLQNYSKTNFTNNILPKLDKYTLPMYTVVELEKELKKEENNENKEKNQIEEEFSDNDDKFSDQEDNLGSTFQDQGALLSLLGEEDKIKHQKEEEKRKKLEEKAKQREQQKLLIQQKKQEKLKEKIERKNQQENTNIINKTKNFDVELDFSGLI